MLNQEQYNKKWHEIKKGFRSVWGKISDDELEQYKRDLAEALDLVELRYNETKTEIKKKYDQLINSFDNDTDRNIIPDESSFERKPIIEDFENDQNTRH